MNRLPNDSLQLYAHRQEDLQANLSRILGALGLALNAGGLAVGSEAVTLAIGRRKARLVFLAQNVSANTLDKLTGKLLSADIPYILLPCSMEILARHLGKSGLVSAAALTRPGFEKIIFNCMEKTAAVQSHDNSTEVQ